jgi:AcrR family transcriptional regulator
MVQEVTSTASARPSLRERRRQETADLILDAVLDLMADNGLDGLTMEAIAERAGVSLRTLYRYFSDRPSLHTAALARHNQSVRFEPPTRPDQISTAYGEVFARFDDVPAVVQAVLAARIAGSWRWDARSQRVREIEEALAPACDRLPSQQAEQATAVIAYLANALAWLSLRDESGLNGEQAGAAIAWAIDTLVADLERRNERASMRSTPPS